MHPHPRTKVFLPVPTSLRPGGEKKGELKQKHKKQDEILIEGLELSTYDNVGSIVMGSPLEYAKYIKIHHNAYCDVFCVFQWASITILPTLTASFKKQEKEFQPEEYFGTK